jgi:hypothetical protein
MVIPGEVQTLIDQAQEAMHNDPNHRLDWHRREAMYATFGPITDPLILRVRGRLAILAAEYVQPIFSERYTRETLVQDLLDAANGLMDGTVKLEDAKKIEDTVYHTFGNEFFRQVNASIAGFAAYKAIIEVRGWANPFQSASKFMKRIVMPDGSKGWSKGTEWTDEQFAEIAGCGDAAGTAAVGFSCGKRAEAVVMCDPQKLHTFWEWWLTEANLAAWNWASSN